MNKIQILLRKEWLELSKQRSLVLMTLLFPTFLSLLPVVVLYAMSHVPGSSSQFSDFQEMTGAIAADPLLANLSPMELGQAIMGKTFALMSFIIPLMIPMSISAYSIVGEKTRRTLEPLLATPVRTWELLLAKSLAALIPTLLASAFSTLVLIVGIRLVSESAKVVEAIVTPGWLLLLLIGTPFMALISITLTVMISSRVNDPRTAQQAAGVIIVPIIALIVGQMAGIVVLSPLLGLVTGVVLAIISAILTWFAGKMFQRETILTRWS